jgi:hypothetical protein
VIEVEGNGEGGLSWLRSIGTALVWAGVAAVLALLRTNRPDIT